jgi:hypothetical protein
MKGPHSANAPSAFSILSIQCAEKGAHVTLLSRSKDKLAAAHKDVVTRVPLAKVFTYSCDVSKYDEVAKAVEAANSFQVSCHHTYFVLRLLFFSPFFFSSFFFVFSSILAEFAFPR